MRDEYFFCPSCCHLLENNDRNADLLFYSYLLDDDDRNALLSYRYLLEDNDDDDNDQHACQLSYRHLLDDDDQHTDQLSYCFLLDDDDQLVFHTHVLRQLDSMHRNPSLVNPTSTMLLTSNTDDQSTTIDYSRFTRFLEVDDSFLSPWNWKPIALNSDQPGSFESRGCSNGAPGSDQLESGDHSSDPVTFMQFQPESFIAQEARDAMKLKEEQPEHQLETEEIHGGIELGEGSLGEWLLLRHP